LNESPVVAATFMVCNVFSEFRYMITLRNMYDMHMCLLQPRLTDEINTVI
jgi:hypothetical protein